MNYYSRTLSAIITNVEKRVLCVLLKKKNAKNVNINLMMGVFKQQELSTLYGGLVLAEKIFTTLINLSMRPRAYSTWR